MTEPNIPVFPHRHDDPPPVKKKPRISHIRFILFFCGGLVGLGFLTTMIEDDKLALNLLGAIIIVGGIGLAGFKIVRVIDHYCGSKEKD